MIANSDIKEYVQSLKASNRLKGEVVHHEIMARQVSRHHETDRPWSDDIKNLLHEIGIQKLYSHQAQAVDCIRAGRHVVITTPTASGKSLSYNLPVIEEILKDSCSRSLYVYPLKALAQDQLKIFLNMVSFLKKTKRPTAVIYDGDTTTWNRKKIRDTPPNVLMTNPEMIHLSLLPYHFKWAHFFSSLKFIVIDEMHSYRGIFGSHMGQVLRRLIRIFEYYSVAPVFIFCSATVANPEQLAKQLTGLDVINIKKSGAPHGLQNIVLIDPLKNPVDTTIQLLKASLPRKLRTIVYTQSRKLTELITVWTARHSGKYSKYISAYRAGFLPYERRKIERKLSSGELLAVISTSALELGIDIGNLDLCVLVGYPGTIVATFQRGGRVGRNGQDSALILVAGENALDQYIIRNPKHLLKREPEFAIANPNNANIILKHLVCAAAELSLKADEAYLKHKLTYESSIQLERNGDLLRSYDRKEIYAKFQNPHRKIDLRGTGSRFNIICSKTGNLIGETDGYRVFKEAHPGAIYFHKGISYIVTNLKYNEKTVIVAPEKANYYTKIRSKKDTKILEVCREKKLLGIKVYSGRLKVTERVTGFEKRPMRGNQKMSIESLDLPPLIFKTEGIWFTIPMEIQRKVESVYLHFMGGIHALEHAVIGMFPLLVMADRNDLGGISTPFHPQIGQSAIFIYDGIPGGGGLTFHAFDQADTLLNYAKKVIKNCPCESGCPLCVHSPKCGSGNRPIDKKAALFLLDNFIETKTTDLNKSKTDETTANDLIVSAPVDTSKKLDSIRKPHRFLNPQLSIVKRSSFNRTRRRLRKKHNINETKKGEINKLPDLKSFCLKDFKQKKRFGVFDLETRRSAHEVGGWHRADLMDISCIVLYDSAEEQFIEFLKDQIPLFIEHLSHLELVIGFNIRKFDYRVLGGQITYDFNKLPTLDILDEVYKYLGFRLSLNHLARVTLGREKSADGLQALKWWKQGKIKKIIEYCRKDVEITKDLFLFGKKYRHLLFNNKAGKTVRIPVRW